MDEVLQWLKWKWSLLGKWWLLGLVLLVGLFITGAETLALLAVGGVATAILLALDKPEVLKSSWTTGRDHLKSWWNNRPSNLET